MFNLRCAQLPGILFPPLSESATHKVADSQEWGWSQMINTYRMGGELMACLEMLSYFMKYIKISFEILFLKYL